MPRALVGNDANVVGHESLTDGKEHRLVGTEASYWPLHAAAFQPWVGDAGIVGNDRRDLVHDLSGVGVSKSISEPLRDLGDVPRRRMRVARRRHGQAHTLHRPIQVRERAVLFEIHCSRQDDVSDPRQLALEAVFDDQELQLRQRAQQARINRCGPLV
jgi:hypothetical protein